MGVERFGRVLCGPGSRLRCPAAGCGTALGFSASGVKPRRPSLESVALCLRLYVSSHFCRSRPSFSMLSANARRSIAAARLLLHLEGARPKRQLSNASEGATRYTARHARKYYYFQ